jgi:endonuclease YncB( thermonuclease family)
MSFRPYARFRRRPYAAAPRNLFRRLLDYALTAAILALLAVVAARLDRVETRKVTGDAVINDGDSITLKGERIRLRGIDAPEYNQTCEKGGAIYPCGRRSREALARLAGSGALECAGWERDRYGRLLGVCTAGGVDLNRRQVEEGWAVAYGDYADAEQAARRRGAGLWAGSFERPRDWRVEHGGMAEGEHDLVAKVLNWLRAIFGFS